MLTKDLLKYTLKDGKAVPKFLKIEPKWLDLTKRLNEIYGAYDGRTIGELSESALDALEGFPMFARGFKKLCEDRLEYKEDEETAAFRTKVLEFSEGHRRDFAGGIKAFSEEVASEFGVSAKELSGLLYGDLAEHRRVVGARLYEGEALVHRFNLAQVQGLLLRADSLTLEVSLKKGPMLRSFFRALKFHRLLGRVAHADKGGFLLELGGPMSVFTGGQAYGMRLANFFPHVLHLPCAFRLVARVTIEKEPFTLEVTEKSGLVSHYKKQDGYIPSELSDFAAAFNKSKGGWKIEPGSALVDLGGQEFCFPDWEVKKGKEKVVVELFHKWHRGPLVGRLKTLLKRPNRSFILGISRKLAKDSEVKEALERAKEQGIGHFLFTDLPTARALLAQLPKD